MTQHQQFHEGEEVEAAHPDGHYPDRKNWRKAKIVLTRFLAYRTYDYLVQFPDGSRAFLDAEHIRRGEETHSDEETETETG